MRTSQLAGREGTRAGRVLAETITRGLAAARDAAAGAPPELVTAPPGLRYDPGYVAGASWLAICDGRVTVTGGDWAGAAEVPAGEYASGNWRPDYRHGTACQHNMTECTAAMVTGMGRCQACGWIEDADGELVPGQVLRLTAAGEIGSAHATLTAAGEVDYGDSAGLCVWALAQLWH